MIRAALMLAFVGGVSVLLAQVPAPSPSAPAFEVASVKPNQSGELGARLRPGREGGLTAVNMPLRELILFAYQLPTHRIHGIPEWTVNARYDIEGKASASPSNAAATDARFPPVALTLRSLLAERFGLKVHRETRSLPIYELRVSRADGKLGPRLVQTTRDCRAFVNRPNARESQANDVPCGVGSGVGVITAGGVPLADFAEALDRIVERPVVDRTGLAGNFDVEIMFNAEQQRPLNLPPGIVLPPTDPNAPSIFTALQEQLGLKLEPSRGPVEVLVIDSVERPTLD
jgi:bla regulator protein blaR1